MNPTMLPKKEVMRVLEEVKDIAARPGKAGHKLLLEHRSDSYAKRDKYLDKYGLDSQDILNFLSRLTSDQYHNTEIDGIKQFHSFIVKVEDSLYVKFIFTLSRTTDDIVISLVSFHPEEEDH
jgi:hypothetical protein